MNFIKQFKISFCIVLALAVAPSKGYSQLDSLLLELDKIHVDTVRLDLLNQVAFAYRSKNADSTYFYGTRALELAQSMDSKKWINRSLYNIGVSHHIKGHFDSAVFHYKKAISLAKESRDQRGLSKLYNNLGLVDWNKGNLVDALDYFLESYEIDEAINDESGMVSSVNNIGLVYRNMGENELALEYFLKAQVMLEPLNDAFRLSQLHNNLGLTYFKLGKGDSSLFHYRKSITLSEESGANCYKAYPLVGITNLMVETDSIDVDSLIYYSSRSIEVSKECGLPKIQSEGLLSLGFVLMLNGDLNAANQHLSDALRIAKEYQIGENIKKSYFYLSEIRKKEGRWKSAYDYFKKYEEIKYQLLNEENIREFAITEARHESEKEKQALLADQENERIRYEKEIEKERSTLTLIVVVAIILVLVVAVLIFIYKREKSVSHRFRTKNEIIERLSLFRNEMTNMIAHDIKTPLNSIISTSTKVDSKEGKTIRKAGYSILRLISDMLDIERFEETKPKLVLEKVAISDLISDARLAVKLILEEKSIKLSFDLPEEVLLEVDKEIIVRVLINLLSNAIKFSPSNSEIRIQSEMSIEGGAERFRIGVKDHGPGIPKADQPRLFEKFYQAEARKLGMTTSTGLGLTFCKMAMDAHEGKIWVESDGKIGSFFWIEFGSFESMPSKVAMREESIVLHISEEERQVLLQYSDYLKRLKVHNISAIVKILDEIDKLNLETKWAKEMRSAIQHHNQQVYTDLLGLI
ncbi:MAG: tetratricopeptide repeat protein [Ekhidna sp.]|nr:tetratricopeptide repeat protein [Ekhidna sp.]